MRLRHRPQRGEGAYRQCDDSTRATTPSGLFHPRPRHRGDGGKVRRRLFRVKLRASVDRPPLRAVTTGECDARVWGSDLLGIGVFVEVTCRSLEKPKAVARIR